MDLYGLPVPQVSTQARAAIDDLLTVRLGAPRGLLSIAGDVRLATDEGTIHAVLSQRLLDEVTAAARAVSAGDDAAMRKALDRFAALVTAAPADQVDPDVATDLLASTGVIAAGPRTYEAEAAQLLGAACLRTDHTGYTGSGFVACLKTKDSGLRFTAAVAADGDYTVRIRYANAMGNTRTMTLSSGSSSLVLQLPTLANWDTWSENTVTFPIAAGDAVTLVFAATDNGNVNVDTVTLEPDLGVVTGA
ncbi:carbohydrate-binding protein [Micromonospora sp. 15K316]|uniref:CBM35 domain-containing protein n=1 Tax=Micromonospora sp. 15K316 TaxID=2530376 RepID=UPI0010521083|nr:CBM35 domain-containing protein [Micromonospora sp. 15K316]TDC38869.1 carbohydrate-binding protein [Micromonospora sp. 15K316]